MAENKDIKKEQEPKKGSSQILVYAQMAGERLFHDPLDNEPLAA